MCRGSSTKVLATEACPLAFGHRRHRRSWATTHIANSSQQRLQRTTIPSGRVRGALSSTHPTCETVQRVTTIAQRRDRPPPLALRYPFYFYFHNMLFGIGRLPSHRGTLLPPRSATQRNARTHANADLVILSRHVSHGPEAATSGTGGRRVDGAARRQVRPDLLLQRQDRSIELDSTGRSSRATQVPGVTPFF